MTTHQRLATSVLLAVAAAAPLPSRAQQPAATGPALDLPTSKRLSAVPGSPQRLNSLPISTALSPDGRYVVTVNAGYGTYESGYMQSLAVLDTSTGVLTDFPESKTGTGYGFHQTLYSGLQFSPDGHHLYASIASLTNPVGDGKENTGSGILVYAFDGGKLTRERIIPVPPQPLAPGHQTQLPHGDPSSTGVPYPAALALIPGTTHILLADNLSDDVLLMDLPTGNVLHRFDLAESNAVPSTYPIALALSHDAHRAFVALWNASEVVELNLADNTIGRRLPLLKPRSPIAPGTHPCALELSPDGRTLFVALSNRDAIAAVDLTAGRFATKGFFDARLPGQTYFGAEPLALALTPDGSRLYAAEAATDTVAVYDTRHLSQPRKPAAARQGFVEPLGFIPTEWMPMSMAMGSGPSAGKLFLATAKGRGTGPNNMHQSYNKALENTWYAKRTDTYIATLLHGSLATLDINDTGRNLSELSQRAVADNRIRAGQQRIRFADGSEAGFDSAHPGAGMARIRHIIYIIKENRTYDQLFGDLALNGHPVGNGDPSLAMYGEALTPNQHKLALQFGVLDNFFDSGEVSGDGHVWSNAAIGSDFLEKGWQQNYRNGQRSYDFEGMVAEGYPILQHIPDVNEPASGYLWTNLAAHGRTLYHFGEYISTTFCNDRKHAAAAVPSQQGPMVTAAATCPRKEIAPGEAIPDNWGGGTNKFAWAIPLIATNVPTKPELVGHFAPEAPDFNLRIPDQIRANIFLRHFAQWQQDRAAGHDTMPSFIQLRLPDDHTAGTTPGGPTPRSSIADNDLAIGRVVEAISHSPFWDDTAIFILEDDAQAGADHVDAHRSIALAISKYAPHGPNTSAVSSGPDNTPTPSSRPNNTPTPSSRPKRSVVERSAVPASEPNTPTPSSRPKRSVVERSAVPAAPAPATPAESPQPFVDSTFYSTVSTIRTMETLLGLPPMNNNDAFSSLMQPEFSGPGDQPPYTADTRNRDNNLIYTANKPTAPGARESSKMDFTHADRAPTDKLNLILWQDAMGDKPAPPQLLIKHKQHKDDDDD